jgi:hypothetical protein
MKTASLRCAAALIAANVLITDQTLAQDHAQPSGAPGMPDQAQMMEMMKKWQEAASPSEHHKHLAHFVGTWETTTKVWMAGPGSPPTETKGTATVKWIMDGRFILEEHSSEMAMPDMATGQIKLIPFTGLGITGYDNYKNMYVSTWVDNQNTHLLTMRGGRDPSGKTFTAYGEMDEPMLDIGGRMVKYVTRIINQDKHVSEMIDLHARDDYKVVEIVYTRKK